MIRPTNLIDIASTPGAQRDYVAHLRTLCERLGVEHATYFSANPVSGTMHGFTTYPDDWKEHYISEGLQDYDPTLRSAARSVAPVDWKRLQRDENYTRVFCDAQDYGLPDQGVTVPIRGMFGEIGLLCACATMKDQEWHSLRRDITGDLLSNAVHLHDTVMNSDPLLKALRQPNLSRREVEILQWVAAGKSQQDVGDILSISPRTVEVHLRSAREKLCTISTPQAVGRAVSLGIIQPG
jgi:DNA-binding CsgD family transcriptional regulator